MDDERFVLVPDAQATAEVAEALFQRLRATLAALLPTATEIEHIGATSVPGCETKGDLDIVLRVPPADFAQARDAMDAHFSRNDGSVRTESFAAYEDGSQPIAVGLQLVAMGSQFDDFTAFRDRLRADPNLVRRYNELKRAYDGKSGDDYRAAKSAFVDSAMQGR